MESLNIVFFIMITGFSFLPLDALPPAPGTDKTHHFIAYAMLMLPAAVRKPANWILLGLVFILYSGAVELIQPFINRYGEWMDMFANSMGIICGAMIGWLINLIVSEK